MTAVVEASQAPPQNLADPRVAKHGGTRNDPKSTYQFAGQIEQANWRRTEVHKHTYGYWCGLCGQRFASPSAVYCHLAKRHDR